MADSYDVILFDLGGVLVELGKSPIPANVKVDESHFSLADWFGSDTAKSFEKGAIAATEFAAAMISDLKIDCSSEQLIDHFTWWPQGMFPQSGELLRQLRRNHRLAVLTNTNELHWPRITDEFELEQLVDHIFASHLLAMIKPESEIFHHVIERLDTEPASILFLDDNLNNIQAALELGIDARLVSGIEQVTRTLAMLELIED